MVQECPVHYRSKSCPIQNVIHVYTVILGKVTLIFTLPTSFGINHLSYIESKYIHVQYHNYLSFTFSFVEENSTGISTWSLKIVCVLILNYANVISYCCKQSVMILSGYIILFLWKYLHLLKLRSKYSYYVCVFDFSRTILKICKS